MTGGQCQLSRTEEKMNENTERHAPSSRRGVSHNFDSPSSELSYLDSRQVVEGCSARRKCKYL